MISNRNTSQIINNTQTHEILPHDINQKVHVRTFIQNLFSNTPSFTGIGNIFTEYRISYAVISFNKESEKNSIDNVTKSQDTENLLI